MRSETLRISATSSLKKGARRPLWETPLEGLAQQHHIHAIPTLIFFKDGKRIGNIEGDVREIPLAEFFAQVSSDFEFNLVKDGKTVEDTSNYKISLKRMVVKEGVMVGFPGEEVLREIIDGM